MRVKEGKVKLIEHKECYVSHPSAASDYIIEWIQLMCLSILLVRHSMVSIMNLLNRHYSSVRSSMMARDVLPPNIFNIMVSIHLGAPVGSVRITATSIVPPDFIGTK